MWEEERKDREGAREGGSEHPGTCAPNLSFGPQVATSRCLFSHQQNGIENPSLGGLSGLPHNALPTVRC